MVCAAKVSFDDNAEFRQMKVQDERDVTQEVPLALDAKSSI